MWDNVAIDRYETAFQIALDVLGEAITTLQKGLVAPRMASTPSGGLHYRYKEPSLQAALMLKSVRLVSALQSAKILIDAGLVLDAGAIMRVIDETDSDIMFLAGPLLFSTDPERRHVEYLDEFFQEEFDNPDPLKSTQGRRRVARRDIRAYVARTYAPSESVSKVVAVTETIEALFSGFVHGAAVHTLDTFDGRDFRVALTQMDGPLHSLREQFVQYIHRAMMAVAIAAKAMGSEALFRSLNFLTRKMFDELGRLRRSSSNPIGD